MRDYLSALWVHWAALMSGIISVIVGVSLRVGRHVSNAVNAWSDIPDWLFIAVGVVGLFYAGFLTWRDQLNESRTLDQRLKELSVPAFVIDAHNTLGKPVSDSDSIILVLMHITNRGAPSVIKQPIVKVIRDGKELNTQWLGIPPGPIELQQPNGAKAVIQQNQYLLSRAGENPIGRNGAAEGFIWVRVPGLKGDALVGSLVKVTIRDVIDKAYSFESTLGMDNRNLFASPW
jgi:hypothetical protein